MIEFIDKTLIDDGTLIDRAHLMGVQGFEALTYNVNIDGSVTETNQLGHTLTTTKPRNGQFTMQFVGEKTITATYYFGGGVITEVIS